MSALNFFQCCDKHFCNLYKLVVNNSLINSKFNGFINLMF